MQHVRTMLLPQAASTERCCCTLCELPWPMHMPRWHWTSHIAHRTHGTFDLDNGTSDTRTRGHGTAGKAVTIRSACPTGVAAQLAQLTVGLAVGSLPSTFPALGRARKRQPSDQVLTNWSTGRLASPRLAARSVAFFIGHIVKHVVHTCKHILQSNIGPDRHQGRDTVHPNPVGVGQNKQFPPCRTRLGCDICTNVARRLIRIEVSSRLKTS